MRRLACIEAGVGCVPCNLSVTASQVCAVLLTRSLAENKPPATWGQRHRCHTPWAGVELRMCARALAGRWATARRIWSPVCVRVSLKGVMGIGLVQRHSAHCTARSQLTRGDIRALMWGSLPPAAQGADDSWHHPTPCGAAIGAKGAMDDAEVRAYRRKRSNDRHHCHAKGGQHVAPGRSARDLCQFQRSTSDATSTPQVRACPAS